MLKSRYSKMAWHVEFKQSIPMDLIKGLVRNSNLYHLKKFREYNS